MQEQERKHKRGVVLEASLDTFLPLLSLSHSRPRAHSGHTPDCKIAFRSFCIGRDRLDDALLQQRLTRALELRKRLFPDPAVTNGFRLCNGEQVSFQTPFSSPLLFPNHHRLANSHHPASPPR